jgi:hypothetical protein
MSACMAKAQGDVAEFCASVPALTDRAAHATWSADFCRARELAQEKCDYVTAMIAGMCAQERDARARRRGILLSDPG